VALSLRVDLLSTGDDFSNILLLGDLNGDSAIKHQPAAQTIAH